MRGGIETAERIVNAPAEEIFAVLADPARHKDIDGSGTVKGTRDATPARLSLGATFGMDMKMGAPYKITNTVVEFEEGRRIAWRHFGGHVWRYVLEPQSDGTTKVTEQFDWTTSKSKVGMILMGAPKRNKKSMVATLDRLATLLA